MPSGRKRLKFLGLQELNISQPFLLARPLTFPGIPRMLQLTNKCINKERCFEGRTSYAASVAQR